MTDQPTPDGGLRDELARLCFRKAQSFYRRDYDHTPMTHTWETTTEDVREGWRKFADAILASDLWNRRAPTRPSDAAPAHEGEG